MDINRFIELLESYLQNRAGEDEQQELFLMVASGKYDAEIVKRIDASFGDDFAEMDSAKAKEIREFIVARPGVSFGRPQGDDRQHGVSRSGPRVVGMWKWIAAALIVGVLAIVAIRMIVGGDANKGRTEVAKTNDVPAPSNTRAVITLADGSKVYLDSTNNGTIAQQNEVAVVKNANGEIVYNANSDQRSANSPSYNTLFNPRGSKVISLTLSDGTRVWLNAESSLKYPIAFNSNSREVEITGEAYFEVKHNSKQPFKVHLPNGSVVEDLGTAFNINAYADENDIKTTLVEGSVKITNTISNSSASSVTLRPGEQSTQSISNRVIRVLKNVNLSEATSWRDNKFYFESADINTIARQLSRWYDVQVEIKDNIPSHFTGIINRDVAVSKVFDMLQKTGAVHFSVENKKIVITR